MDNHISQQPNGIIPRPASQSRRPPQPPPQQQQQRAQISSEQADFMDDDDDEEFGLSDNREQQRERPPNIPRSSSKDLKRSKSIGNAPKFLKIAVIGMRHALVIYAY